jgi:hypothetical protein
VGDDRQEEFGRQIFLIVRGEPDRAGLGRVMNDVQDQPEEAVDEGFPGVRFATQATLEQIAIDVRQRHEYAPFTQSANGCSDTLANIRDSKCCRASEQVEQGVAASDARSASPLPEPAWAANLTGLPTAVAVVDTLEAWRISRRLVVVSALAVAVVSPIDRPANNT